MKRHFWTEAEVRDLLASYISHSRNQKQLAALIGISPAMLNAVLQGRKKPGTAIEDFLGFDRVSMYVTRAPE